RPVSSAHGANAHLTGILAHSYGELRLAEGGGGVEGGCPAPKVGEARVLEVAAEVLLPVERSDEVDPVDPVGVLQEGGRAKQEPVGDAEHRGVGADAERQREHHGGGESRLLSHSAKCVSDVLWYGVEHVKELLASW